MRFSLIVGTVGRTDELHELLASLCRQSHRDFEVIIVDQNTDGRLFPILEAFGSRLEIHHLSSPLGLSRARNIGLRQMTGDVVCFPDDDCRYPEDLLFEVNRLFTKNPGWDGVIGDSVDDQGTPTLPWRDRTGKLTQPKCWRRAISYAIFLRTTVISEIGGFDRNLGVGAGSAWGSGEDNDLVLRALKAGSYVHFDRAVRVIHPQLFRRSDQLGRAKRYSYALGEGKLLQKHPMPLWWRALFFAVPLLRASLSSIQLNVGRTHLHWITLSGRLAGFRSTEALDRVLAPSPLDVERIPQHPSATPLKARSVAGGRE